MSARVTLVIPVFNQLALTRGLLESLRAITELILGGRTQLKAVNDTWGSPTYARDLLVSIRTLIDGGHTGLYHVANEGRATRLDMARSVCEALDKRDVEILPVASTDFPQAAPRPRSEVVRCRALEQAGLPPRPWREALAEYVTRELIGGAPRV